MLDIFVLLFCTGSKIQLDILSSCVIMNSVLDSDIFVWYRKCASYFCVTGNKIQLQCVAVCLLGILCYCVTVSLCVG